MPPQNDELPLHAALRALTNFVGYARVRTWAELRRPALPVGVALAVLLAWAGTHLEILHFDERAERAWGVALSTAETLALLLVLPARLRGADLAGSEGWPDALRASAIGPVGLSASETLGAVAPAWIAAAACTSLLLVFDNRMAPSALGLATWGASLFVELALLAAWLALGASWMGRMPGLGVAVGVVVLGRLGVGGIAAAFWPTPAVAPPGGASLGALGASLATLGGLLALTAASRGTARSFD